MPKTAIDQLAEKFKLSTGTIGQILRGNRKNESVILAAVEILAEHNQQKQRAAEYLESL